MWPNIHLATSTSAQTATNITNTINNPRYRIFIHPILITPFGWYLSPSDDKLPVNDSFYLLGIPVSRSNASDPELPLIRQSHYNMCAECIQALAGGGDVNYHRVSLEELAKRYNLSTAHFQKTFKSYVGVTPKQFQQSLLLTKSKLTLHQQSIEQNSFDLGLSSASRLHDAFVTIEAISPGEFKSLGDSLSFTWSVEESIFGSMLVISTKRGIYYLGFHPSRTQQHQVLKSLSLEYPKAIIRQAENNVILGFDPFLNPKEIKLFVKGSNFQIKAWQALLNTRTGDLLSYKNLAGEIGQPSASRAIGKAIGSNPVAFLIPCHRIIQQSGALSGYRWGVDLKQTLISWEHAFSNQI